MIVVMINSRLKAKFNASKQSLASVVSILTSLNATLVHPGWPDSQDKTAYRLHSFAK